MFFFYTVPQGQVVAVWDKAGRRTLVGGPRRLFLFRRRVELLEQFVAGPEEYLIVRYRDGHVEHVRGPAERWFDPVEHAKIEVADALALDASEAVVVYRQIPGAVNRRVVRGPAMLVPQPDEWLHEFRWHGADPANPRRKVPRALQFTKLRVIPDQMYFDVDDVRTADDALICVKVMIFFELVDIQRMLDRTHDPVADFINALSADVIDFAAARPFEKFKDDTEQLNTLETYAQLTRMADRIGYRIDKVVYRGYQAGTKFQAMHDDAIEKRTRLKLEAETEAQAQELADLKLEREQERSERKQAMERAEADHQNRLKRTAHEEQLRQRETDHAQALRQREQEQAVALVRARAEHDEAARATQIKNDLLAARREAVYRQRLAFLQSIHTMQVDLTRYLTARHERPDRLIRVDGRPRAQLHLHEED